MISISKAHFEKNINTSYTIYCSELQKKYVAVH